MDLDYARENEDMICISRKWNHPIKKMIDRKSLMNCTSITHEYRTEGITRRIKSEMN